ncbi:XTP/dITP diphosphohydrolase [Flexibacter flexilis DSM 6793]|uniref:dITP/XTP pyrophosphatase n=1 Tax=Flexibacter flexilis DSM 6793 TaxID=927664 RepID=A0A1I1EAH0_9BACT|nr:RdgB/HAM1 family non-canonical purine NTP pyrophosphatase [Flexibacter flexilis]SFB83716.1 XTP/dITP diphosphohydrolase [Flexibacter flexilis DSM 6793]
MLKICLATNNRHKIEELLPLLGEGIELVTLRDIGCEVDLPENQDTLQGNALEKAQYVWDNFGVSCIADDTGLEVATLDGAPGVYSARYAGPARSDAANVALLLQNLANKTNRTAQFRTCIALILGGEKHFFEGKIEGEIAVAPTGTNGFGYDPVFVPVGFAETFAQMPLEQKNTMSHRARATAKLLDFLKTKV